MTHRRASIIFFYNCYKRIPLASYESDFYTVILSICCWMNARMSNAGVRVTEFVCSLRSPAKWLWSRVDISVIWRNTAELWARLALKNTKAFSLTARIVLKDDPALAHELARLRLNAKRWKLSQASRLFIFKGQQLVVDNNCDVSSAYVAILCQFHRYVTVSRRGCWRSLQFFNKGATNRGIE